MRYPLRIPFRRRDAGTCVITVAVAPVALSRSQTPGSVGAVMASVRSGALVPPATVDGEAVGSPRTVGATPFRGGVPGSARADGAGSLSTLGAGTPSTASAEPGAESAAGAAVSDGPASGGVAGSSGASSGTPSTRGLESTAGAAGVAATNGLIDPCSS